MSLKNFLQGKLIKTQISELFGIILDSENNLTLIILRPGGSVQSKIFSEFIILDKEFGKGKYMKIKLLGYEHYFIVDPI